LRHIVFDCDGVLLDSNLLKQMAFSDVFDDFEIDGKDSFIDYVKSSGGVTALEKFKKYFDRYGVYAKIDPIELERYFRIKIKSKLSIAEHDPFIEKLPQYHEHYIFSIISGGNKSEITETFEVRNLLHCFNGEIFGNPTPKEENFNIFVEKYPFNNSVYIGDSLLDLHLAEKYGFEFIFVSQWSEVTDWHSNKLLSQCAKVDNVEGAINQIANITDCNNIS
jgi:phosphoglycolate phosphatase-like HAD superfamily hydrolase